MLKSLQLCGQCKQQRCATIGDSQADCAFLEARWDRALAAARRAGRAGDAWLQRSPRAAPAAVNYCKPGTYVWPQHASKPAHGFAAHACNTHARASQCRAATTPSCVRPMQAEWLTGNDRSADSGTTNTSARHAHAEHTCTRGAHVCIGTSSGHAHAPRVCAHQFKIPGKESDLIINMQHR